MKKVMQKIGEFFVRVVIFLVVFIVINTVLNVIINLVFDKNTHYKVKSLIAATSEKFRNLLAAFKA